jgi:hypothetical protein
MKPLRTAQDIHGAPRTSAYQRSSAEPGLYALLSGLARERQRLLSQQESWQRKLTWITRRLAEIDAETGKLHGRLPQAASGRPVRGPSRRLRRPSSVH